MVNQLLLKDIKEIDQHKNVIQKFLETSKIKIKENFNFGSLNFDSMTTEEIEEKRNEVLSYFDQIPGFQGLGLAIIQKIAKENNNNQIDVINIYREDEKKILFELFEGNGYKNRDDTSDLRKVNKIFPGGIQDFINITVDGLSKLQQPEYPKEVDDELLFNITIKALNSTDFGNGKNFIKYLGYKLAEKGCSLRFIHSKDFNGMRPFGGTAVKLENKHGSKNVIITHSSTPFYFEQEK